MKKIISLPIVAMLCVVLISGCASHAGSEDGAADESASVRVTPQVIVSELSDMLAGNGYGAYTGVPRLNVAGLVGTKVPSSDEIPIHKSIIYGSLNVASGILEQYGSAAYDNLYNISFSSDHSSLIDAIPYALLAMPSKMAVCTGGNGTTENLIISSEADTSEINGLWLYTVRYLIRAYYDMTTESFGLEMLMQYIEKSSGGSAYHIYYSLNGDEFVYINAGFNDPVHGDWDGFCIINRAGESLRYNDNVTNMSLKSYFAGRTDELTSFVDFNAQFSKPVLQATVEFDEETFSDIVMS